MNTQTPTMNTQTLDDDSTEGLGGSFDRLHYGDVVEIKGDKMKGFHAQCLEDNVQVNPKKFVRLVTMNGEVSVAMQDIELVRRFSPDEGMFIYSRKIGLLLLKVNELMNQIGKIRRTIDGIDEKSLG